MYPSLELIAIEFFKDTELSPHNHESLKVRLQSRDHSIK
jgi:hypothetical protein